MFDNIIGIRTNQWSYSEQTLYNTLLTAYSPEQIFVVIDEITTFVDVPSYINKISLNNSFFDIK